MTPRTFVRPLRIVAATALLTSLALGSAAGLSQAAMPDLYPLPAGVTAGTGIVAAPDGQVWFATGDSGPTPRIGRMDPAAATVGTSSGMTFFDTPTFVGAPCCATFIRSLALDAATDRLWFTRSDGAYGFGATGLMNAGTTDGFSSAHLPAAIDLNGLAVDPSTSAAWFAETSSSNVETPAGSHYYPGDRIARTDGSLAVIESSNIAQQGGSPTLSDSRYDAEPQGVASDGHGGVWFAQANAGLPGYRIAHTAANGAYDEYLITPCVSAGACSGSFTGSGPTDVALAPDGAVWFTNQINNSVGRLDPAASTFTQYSVASIDPTLAGGRPMQLRAASDGTLWLAEYGGTVSNTAANAIVRIVPNQVSPTATVYKTGSGAPIAVAPSATGDVWFTLITASSPAYLGRLDGAAGGGDSGGTGGGGGGTGGGAGGGGTGTGAGAGGSGSGGGDTGGSGGAATSGDGTGTDGAAGGGAGPPAPTPTIATPSASAPAPGAIILQPASIGVARIGTVATSGGTATVRQICVGPPQDRCSLVYELDANEYVRGFPGAHSRAVIAAKPKRKPAFPVLGKLSASLHGGQTKTLRIRLNAKARKALAHARSIKATLVVTQRVNGGTPKVVQRKRVTFKLHTAQAKAKHLRARAHTAKVVLAGRYARCTDPHPKTYTTCPDVATSAGAHLSIQFMVKKRYCSGVEPETPGVWSFYNDLKLRNGKLTGTLDHNNYAADAQGTPDDIGIAFRWTGKLVSPKRIHLVLKGKVTKAGPVYADCIGVSFTETHDLRAVGF